MAQQPDSILPSTPLLMLSEALSVVQHPVLTMALTLETLTTLSNTAGDVVAYVESSLGAAVGDPAPAISDVVYVQSKSTSANVSNFFVQVTPSHTTMALTGIIVGASKIVAFKDLISTYYVALS